MTQKVVIPKGLVNPGETTIVEIPKNLQHAGTVVARRPRPKAYNPDETPASPQTPKLVKKRSYTRRTYPTKKKPFETKAALDDSTKGYSYYGRPFDPDATPPHEFKPWYPKSPHDRYMTKLSPGDVTYDYDAYDYSLYRSTDSGGEEHPRIKTGFQENLGPHHSTFRQDTDSPETSLYRDFRPGKRSSPTVPSPPHLSHKEDSTPVESFHSEVTIESPDGIEEEITDEKSYWEYSDLGSGSPVDSSQDYHQSSSGGYHNYQSSGSGGYQNYEMSGLSPASSSGRSGKMTPSDLLDSLGNLESVEMSQIMGDLNKFQSARRKLVFDASSLASAADVSMNLIGNSTI